MRRRYIAGNWKMNHGIDASRDAIAALRKAVADVDDVEIAIFPAFTSLAAARDAAAGSDVAVGAQNVHWAEDGAFTGEISAAMLKEMAIDRVLIGHSERRQYFGETDETVNRRLHAALGAGLNAIVCVGETLEERQGGATTEVISRQITGGLEGVDAGQLAAVVIAYEPVWAIGTGVTASDEEAQEVHALIRRLAADQYSADAAEDLRILYGGSVKPGNVAGLIACPDIDGGLVGGASLVAADFADLVHNARP